MHVIKATFFVALVCVLLVAIPVAGVILGIILAIIILSNMQSKDDED